MRFTAAFVQHYFLEVDPPCYTRVAGALREGEPLTPEDESDGVKRVGEWRLFAWLDRPSIWAVRSIQRTSGLDTFLFDDDGLPGVTDVAEMITFPFEGRRETAAEGRWLATHWEDFAGKLKGSGVLCVTFLWPDWDALSDAKVWGCEREPERVPKRSQVLAAIRAAFIARLRAESEAPHAFAAPPLMLTASAGDADLLLYGWVSSAVELDRCLYLLTQMTVADLGAILFGEGPFSTRSVFRASQTEMAVDLRNYLDLVDGFAPGAADPVGLEIRLTEMGQCFAGELYAEVGLSRGYGPLAQLKDRLTHVAGHEIWCERAIFGGEDMILEARRLVSFREVMALQARLDAALQEDHGFVRRSSLRIGVENSYGKTQALSGPERAAAGGEEPLFRHSRAAVPEGLAAVRQEIQRLAAMQWREDVRIIERMVERCVTIQKAFNIRLETRQMAVHALANIVRHCATIRRYEAEIQDIKGHCSPDHQNLTPEEREEVIREFVEDIRLMRKELLLAGICLDRALSHHSKGVIPLLLHPSSQARGPEHFGSEVGLSVGLGAMFQSAALRVWAELDRSRFEEVADTTYGQLEEALENLQHPTVYASHEPDFGIHPSLGLLRVPRWALWYPPASSHLMHEFGHAVAGIGHLQYLLTAVFSGFAGSMGEVPESLQAPIQRMIAICGLSPEMDLGNFVGRVTVGQEVGVLPKASYPLFEETACDLVSRLYSYPPGEEWDDRWLEHCLKYVLPFMGREEPDFIKGRIQRLLGAYVAIRLLREARRPGTADFSMEDLQRVEGSAAAATEAFAGVLKAWGERIITSQEKVQFPSWMLDELQSLCNDPLTLRWRPAQEGSRHLPELVRAGFLLCCALALPPDGLEKDLSAIKAALVWRAVLRVGWQHQDEMAIVETLERCEVPREVSHQPERLPSLLVYSVHAKRKKMEPASRMALSFYLRDLYLLKANGWKKPDFV